MTKSDLITRVTMELDTTPADGKRAVEAVFNGLTAALKGDGKFVYAGFGTFNVKDLPERPGRNPKTGELLTIGPSKRVSFKAAVKLKGIL